MYLKSLILKGFKSFADRTVINLEPGITAVVGPNGSGKSNISDAVMWVLGERNAKNLRGQSMEDVIFAGSNTRKSVAFAEVELVLDNSDGTLPVDYTEVTIGRRMYRTGESEYSINGTPCRRLDILDILHDSGLGTGTHSIISQGNLDAILKSRPEDRRSLIEEAAGVLKHKQNKEKASQKLAAMDVNLTRIRDVVGEINRQLGPLERKAERAIAYDKAIKELSQLELALAVEDLRTLQTQWNAACAAETDLLAQLEEKRQVIQEADKEWEAIQQKMSEAAGASDEISELYRKMSASTQSIDAALIVIREKKKNLLTAIESTMFHLQQNVEKEKGVQHEIEDGEIDAQACQQALTQAQQTCATLKEQWQTIHDQRAAAEAEREGDNKRLSALESQIDVLRTRCEDSKEALSDEQVRMKVIQAQLDDNKQQLPALEEQVALSEAEFAQAEEASTSATARYAEARDAVATALNNKNQAQTRRDELKSEMTSLSAELDALHALEKSVALYGAAHVSMQERFEKDQIPCTTLGQILQVVPEHRALVERLLGANVTAFLTEGPNEVERALKIYQEEELDGLVSLVSKSPVSFADVRKNYPLQAGMSFLVDSIDCAPEHAGIVEALFGNVVVCEHAQLALSAAASAPAALIFATPLCFMCSATGCVSFGGTSHDEKSILATQDRIRTLEARQEELQLALSDAEREVKEAESVLSDAQESSMNLSFESAAAQGHVNAAQSHLDDACTLAQNCRALIESLEADAASLQASVNDQLPAIHSMEEHVASLVAQKDTLARDMEARRAAAEPLRAQEEEIFAKVNVANAAVTAASEKAAYATLTLQSRRNTFADLQKDVQAQQRALLIKRAAINRITPILSTVETLQTLARRRVSLVEDLAKEKSAASSGLAGASSQAHKASQVAHQEWDAVNAQLSDVRIEKGRLELQVKTATDTIVVTCKTPLEFALHQEPLQDVATAQDEAMRLRKRIANMGTINPDAAVEYGELKKRYDYLVSQLSDMEAARKALVQISAVIDTRMKSDFMTTFDAVNANFQEIFALLIPGGQAQLTLVDTEDPENPGIEVSAQPHGKLIKKLSLLSGGEKSLTALALLFAIYRHRNAPFYILDEVEAALDDINLKRLITYLDSQRNNIQLIMITHQRRTMEIANVLYGISMRDGVTKVISQKLETALQSAQN